MLLLTIIDLIIVANTENIYYAYKNNLALKIMEITVVIYYLYIVFFVIFRCKLRDKKTIKDEKNEEIEILQF